MRARDLGVILLLLFVPFIVWPRPMQALGPPRARPACEVWVEADGVRCLERAEARKLRLRSGDTSEGRMAPARLAALSVPVDANRASAEELASLEGVGPRLAERIVAARPFASVDDVARVPGVGRKRLERLRPRLTVSLDE
jgi:competence ComEA-like helix-hairpin-helix protein